MRSDHEGTRIVVQRGFFSASGESGKKSFMRKPPLLAGGPALRDSSTIVSGRCCKYAQQVVLRVASRSLEPRRLGRDGTAEAARTEKSSSSGIDGNQSIFPLMSQRWKARTNSAHLFHVVKLPVPLSPVLGSGTGTD